LKFGKVIATALLATASACSRGGGESEPEPGTELYAVAPETVREVVFSAPDRKLYAYRWAPSDSFRLVIASRGSADVEHCTAGEGFTRWLAAASRMPVVKKLDDKLDAASTDWTDLQLRDASQLEPIDVHLHLPSAAGQSTVIQYGAAQYSVDVDAAALGAVRSGCAGLGATR
jgi:hypothetical protein